MKKNKAFSLIELSIVILIIGILIAGVTQSSRLVIKMRVASAQAQTQSSPVAGIKDLVLWLEATTEPSFAGSEPEDNSLIENWYDINPQAPIKLIANQPTSDNQPTYVENSINSLPAINFSGNNDMILNNLSSGTDNSYFFVVKPLTTHVEGIFDSAPTVGYPFRNFCQVVCPADGKFEMWNGGPAPFVTLGLSANTPYIIYVSTFLDNTVNPPKTMSYYRNGTFVSTITDTDPNATAWTTPRIGSVNIGGVYYSGVLGEAIIFGHTLKTEERQAVTTYLGKKWGIQVQQNN